VVVAALLAAWIKGAGKEDMRNIPKEHGILFSAQMVRAILDGHKTQTRRAVKLREFQPSDTPGYDFTFRCRRGLWQDYRKADLLAKVCPHPVGTRLWVKETLFTNGMPLHSEHLQWCHAATVHDPILTAKMMKKVPSIHCPRGCSRITLEVTAVRVQPLHGISDSDAVAEGIELICHCGEGDHSRGRCDGHNFTPMNNAVDDYSRLWEAINGDGSWNANPWVWAYTFKKVRP
jgi:hypothetical protein